MDVDISEEVRLLKSWNQALTLLWPEDGDLQDLGRRESHRDRDDEEAGLK
jgi:hypothetical protein